MSTENSSLAKMLALLEAFTKERHMWTVEAMAEHFGYTHSSTYRYVRELCRAGLLVRMPNGEYVIGARIVVLEALIRQADPLTKACMPMLEGFTRILGCHGLLSNAYGEHLINVVHLPGNEEIDLAFVGGRQLPWFRGATSRAILAFLPRKRVRKLFDRHYEGERSKQNWRQILASLKEVSDQGFCISRGELQKGVIGVGAPLIVSGDVMGSVTLVFSTRHSELMDLPAIGRHLAEGCAESTTTFDYAESQVHTGPAFMHK